MKNNVFYFSREKEKVKRRCRSAGLYLAEQITRRREISQNASATVSASAKQSASPKMMQTKDNKTSNNYRRFGTDRCLD